MRSRHRVDENDVYIEPGETETFSVWAPYLKSANFAGDLNNNELIVDSTFYRSEFHKLGEHPVPESTEKPTFLDNGFDIEATLKAFRESFAEVA